MNYLAKNWLAICLLFTGIAVTALGLVNRQRAIESVDWPTVPGVVTKSTIVTKTKRRRSRRQGPRKVHLPEIEYSYTVGNTQLQHKQMYFQEGSAAQVIKKYPSGSEVVVTYNPDDLNDSFLEPPSMESNAVVCGLGTFFILIGVAMLVLPRILQKPQVKSPMPVAGPQSNESSHPVTINAISHLIGIDVRELIVRGWTDRQIDELVDQILADQLITT